MNTERKHFSLIEKARKHNKKLSGVIAFAVALSGCAVKEKKYRTDVMSGNQDGVSAPLQNPEQQKGSKEETLVYEEFELDTTTDEKESGTVPFMSESLYKKAVDNEIREMVELMNTFHPEQPITDKQFLGALMNIQEVVNQTPWLKQFVETDNLLEGKSPMFAGHTVQTSDTGTSQIDVPQKGFAFLSAAHYSLEVDGIDYRVRIPKHRRTVQLTYVINTSDKPLKADVSNYEPGAVWACRTEMYEDNNNAYIDPSPPRLNLITLTEQLIASAYLDVSHAQITIIKTDGMSGGTGTPESLRFPLNETLGFVLDKSHYGKERGDRRERPPKKPNQPRRYR